MDMKKNLCEYILQVAGARELIYLKGSELLTTISQ